MGKLRAAGTITHGPHIWCSRFEAFVDLDVAARVQFDTSEVRPDAPRVRGSAGCNEEIGAFNLLFAIGSRNKNSDLLSRPSLNALDMGLQQDVDSFVSKKLHDRSSDVGILATCELLSSLDHSDFGTKPPHRLRELEADIPSAKHDQVLRHALQFQEFYMRHRCCVGHPWHLGHGRARTQVEKHAIATK